jgi:L-aspartate oxidase
VFGARAARAASAEPPPDQTAASEADGSPVGRPTPSPETRAALWRYAGLERDAEGLAVLADNPHPLARLIALSALARQESRGAHRRRDCPTLDHALDQLHVTVSEESAPALERWA